ncbi:aminotransferase class V-fold PLP-dependent enzyme [Aliikangiella coralliicola]|nr:cysteine desulfurase [Aliikangiella coralliicola]
MSNHWKNLFPALTNSNIAYLDSASSCQVPEVVIDAVSQYLREGHGNPHRGMYSYSENAEAIFNRCREKVANFLNCQSTKIAFTKGTTESINLVANSLQNKINSDDTILVTQMEHHANLLPWQRLSEQTGARLNLLPVTQNGELKLDNLDNFLADNCAIFAFTHCSNVIGTSNPINQLVSAAKKHHVATLIDGAQAVAHNKVDVLDLDCDFYAFSGHKIYSPGGIGVLYSRQPDSISPLLLGGGIVNRVTDSNYQLTDEITRFEAGSINMPGIVGLDAALDFMTELDIEKIAVHEIRLIDQIRKAIEPTDYKIISHQKSKNIVSIASAQFHSHDIASILADEQVAIRAGHHCAQPCLSALGFKHCVRISVGLYNSEDDLNKLMEALEKVRSYLK